MTTEQKDLIGGLLIFASILTLFVYLGGIEWLLDRAEVNQRYEVRRLNESLARLNSDPTSFEHRMKELSK